MSELDPRIIELVEEHFPKGESKERGEAMVLVGEMLLLKQGDIKELADRLIGTLDDSVPAVDADAIVADVAKSLYNDILRIEGNIVIDKSHPVARIHGGFGPNGKRAAAVIAKYKFEPISDTDDDQR